MYNRYIPQPDGSYRRNPMQEPRANPQRQPPHHQHASPVQPAPPPPISTPPPLPHHPHPPKPESIPGFLRQLIPQGFDTGDLIIVLLLLLMAGDNPESRSNALLTLALYFVL